MSEAATTCARCGGVTQSSLVRGMSVDKCTSCGAVTLSEAELHEVVSALSTEEAPTEWVPTEETERTVLQSLPTQASPDATTSVLGLGDADLPFHVESRPPPPKREHAPPVTHFSGPPMLTEDFEAPHNREDLTEEAPKLTMPVRRSALVGEPQLDLSSLREASSPPRERGPAPASDFNETPTRPSYPLEGTLEPADEVGSYLLDREDKRQKGAFATIGVVAIIAILGVVGLMSYLGLVDSERGAVNGGLGLSEVISTSDGRIAVEVDEPSVAELLPPEPRRPTPAPEIKVSRTAPAPRVGPTRVVRAAVPVVVPVTSPGPSPTSVVAPTPKPSGGFASLVAEGWASVSGDPSSAVDAFSGALRYRPGDPEASYGLGYSLWRLDRQSEALPHLCLALRSGGVDIQREVNGMLARSSLSCG